MQNHSSKSGGEASLRLFHKKSKLRKSLDQQSVLWPIAFILDKPILEKKRGLELVSCLIFCMVFEEKYLSCYILLTDQISLPDCLYFLIKPFFYITKKSGQKNVNTSRTKRVFNVKWKVFFIIFKGFSVASVSLGIAHQFSPLM